MTAKHLAAAMVHMMLNSEYPCSYCYRSPHLRDLVTLYSVLQCTGPIKQKNAIKNCLSPITLASFTGWNNYKAILIVSLVRITIIRSNMLVIR